MKRTLFVAFVIALTLCAQATNVEKRIRFARGASEATVAGSWAYNPRARGETFDRYILGAARGQTMVVRLQASSKCNVLIWHNDANNGVLGAKSGATGSCTIRLPSNGDYNVDVGPDVDHPKSFSYSLNISIR